MIFRVLLDNGNSQIINGADSAEHAMRKAERQQNESFFVGVRHAAVLAAENPGLRTDGDGFMHKVNPCAAVSAERMLEVNICGGYGIVSANQKIEFRASVG